MAFLFKEKKTKKEPSAIIETMREVKNQMIENEKLFNLSLNDDLTDYALYEDIALKAKYDYLIKKYKEEESFKKG